MKSTVTSPLRITMLIIALLAFWLWTPDIDRATLEARYLNSPAEMREVMGASLHVRDSGPRNAPALIFLHGFAASLHTWEPWAKELERDYRVIRIDLPGCGLSAPDPTQDYSDARSIQLLLGLMDQLDVGKATWVGNSIGGRLAWTLAALHPERVDKLVLISPDGFASQGFEYGKKPDVPASLKLMRYVLPAPVLRMSLAPAYADESVLTDDLSRRYHDLIRSPGNRDALLQRMAQTVLIDPVPQLKRIHASTLLLWGEQDKMIPIDNAQDYLKVLPNSRLVALKNLGHLPHEEDPVRSLVPLREFLQSNTR